MSDVVDFNIAGTAEALSTFSTSSLADKYNIKGRIVYELLTDLEACMQLDPDMIIKDSILIKSNTHWLDHENNCYRRFPTWQP